LFDGAAGDLAEAVDTMRAHMSHLSLAVAGADRSA
jgi:hypothetical protein